MKQKRKLTQIFSLMLSSVSLVSILLIGALWISFETNRSNEEIKKIEENRLKQYKTIISSETSHIINHIKSLQKTNEIKYHKDIKFKANEAFDFINTIYGTSSNLKRVEIEKIILSGLNGIKQVQQQSNYFVITTEGQQLLGDNNSIKDLFNLNNPADQRFSDIAKTLSRVKEGFFYYITRDSLSEAEDGRNTAQVTHFRLFEPYGWIIGVNEKFSDWETSTQKEILDWISSAPLPAETYVMIINFNGDVLYHPDDHKSNNCDLGLQTGANVFDDAQNTYFNKVAASIINGAKSGEKNFIRYQPVDQESMRISYYSALDNWQWAVSTWMFYHDVEAELAEYKAELAKNMRSQIIHIVAISASMLLVIILLSKVLSALAIRSFSAFFIFFENATNLSTEIDPDKQPFEEFARLAQAANEMISQRKIANNLLRESEFKFKTIFNVSPQIITISTLTGILVDTNDEFRKFSALEPLQAIGRPLEESFSISHEDRKALWEDLKNKEALIGQEIEGIDAMGLPLTFLVFGKKIQMSGKTLILAIFINITALKVAQNEKLVLQEKLSQSTKMEAMGLMAAEVAHDLNNILSGIIGYPQLLLMEPNITDKQKETLNEILKTGQKAAAVVSDLLTIARGVASIKESISINSLITDYANSPEGRQLKELFPKVELKLDLGENAGNIMGSNIHLTKVIMNLISNSFEAMPPDKESGQVIVSTKTIDLESKISDLPDDFEPGRYVLITVSDNGHGIADMDAKKIFQPFYSKKTKGRSGTGLGLAIVWNTIIDHHGYINLETSPNGTTFSLYFKLTTQQVAIKEEKQLDEYRGANQRILIVDDVEIQRKLASKMLQTLGYAPVAVASGEAAVKYLKKNNVELVILDMIMHPGMNGRETYAEIMKFKPQQKAIIASGMAETEEVAKAQAMGAGQFVNKPYTIEELAAAVKKTLQAD